MYSHIKKLSVLLFALTLTVSINAATTYEFLHDLITNRGLSEKQQKNVIMTYLNDTDKNRIQNALSYIKKNKQPGNQSNLRIWVDQLQPDMDDNFVDGDHYSQVCASIDKENAMRIKQIREEISQDLQNRLEQAAQ